MATTVVTATTGFVAAPLELTAEKPRPYAATGQTGQGDIKEEAIFSHVEDNGTTIKPSETPAETPATTTPTPEATTPATPQHPPPQPSAAAAAEKARDAELTERYKTLPTYTPADVAHHGKPADNWIVIHGDVYDVTRFQHEHPGGPKMLLGVAGKDATKKFDKYHRQFLLSKTKYRELVVGKLDASAPQAKGGFLSRWLK